VKTDSLPRLVTLLVASVACASLLACEGGPLPLDVSVGEPAAAAGPRDKVELVVKSVPGADLTFQGKTESTGESPNHTFSIPKSSLKLGKNTFTVEGVGGSFPGKRIGSATATLDVTPKMLMHFGSPPNVAQEGAFTCGGTMCDATSIAFTKPGLMPLAVKSDIASVMRFDSREISLTAGVVQVVEVNLVSQLTTFPIAQGDELQLPFTIQANNEKATDTLVLRGNGMTGVALRELRKVEQGPLTFAGEAAAPSDKRDALVVIGAPSVPLIVVGKAKTFQDVDLVAIATPTEHRFPCPTGAGLLYVDMQVKVYARRTGAVVGTKAVSADRTTCPPTPAADVLKSVVREDDTKHVMAEFLKK
jgi:hypothetical protein